MVGDFSIKGTWSCKTACNEAADCNMAKEVAISSIATIVGNDD